MNQQTNIQFGAYQLLTSPGPAAIAVVRARGPLVATFLRQHIRARTTADPDNWASGSVFRGELLDESGAPIDDMLLSVHTPGPVWDVRLHVHGSPWLVGHCVEMLKATGIAEQSEAVSTLWQSSSKIEAEAHALLPRMLTLAGVQWLTRQSRLLPETLRALAELSDTESARRQSREIAARGGITEWFARPLRVALIGPPNAGKSTLANTLADRCVSLVSPTPGTTRDWVEIPGEIDGFPVRWLDTAGLRPSNDELEAEAVRRTRRLMGSADAILLVLDSTTLLSPPPANLGTGYAGLRPACVALNKVDLIGAKTDLPAGLPADWRNLAVVISAIERTGLDELIARLLESVAYDSEMLAAPAAFTERQVEALRAATAGNDCSLREHLLTCL